MQISWDLAWVRFAAPYENLFYLYKVEPIFVFKYYLCKKVHGSPLILLQHRTPVCISYNIFFFAKNSSCFENFLHEMRPVYLKVLRKLHMMRWIGDTEQFPLAYATDCVAQVSVRKSGGVSMPQKHFTGVV